MVGWAQEPGSLQGVWVPKSDMGREARVPEGRQVWGSCAQAKEKTRGPTLPHPLLPWQAQAGGSPAPITQSRAWLEELSTLQTDPWTPQGRESETTVRQD